MTLLRFLRIVAEKTLPRKVVLLLGAAYGFLKSPRRSYSQKGEDILVLDYFDRIDVERGVYCDIGCFHPVWISNTHLLDRNGWTGFAIDIDDFKLKTMSLYRRGRVKCILGAVCGSAAQGQRATVYKFRKGWSDIDTLDRETAEKYRLNGAGDFFETDVDLLDVNQLLSQMPHINFLNIDIEGVDKEIIMAMDLSRFKPELILFEDNEVWGGDNAVVEKLLSAGYTKLFVNGGSVAYVVPPKS